MHFQPPEDLLEGDLFDYAKTDDQKKIGEDMILTKYNPKHPHDIMRLNSVNDYTSHLNNVDSDLDSLKDLLRNDPYQLDANQMLEVSN